MKLQIMKASNNVKKLHPNSRKALKVAKKQKRKDLIKIRKSKCPSKQEILGEKLMWFKKIVDEEHQSQKCLERDEVEKLVNRYMRRFEEELEQIELQNNMKNRKSRQHASREDAIRFTLEREQADLNGNGLEIPDLVTEASLGYFLEWNGEMRFVPNIQLMRFKQGTKSS